MWGCRVFTIDTADIGTDDPEVIERLAIQTCPSDYLVHSMKAVRD
ncbi:MULTISPECIES: hypothetical protein [Xanthomonas]|nr:MULTISPECIES: hypothetical protein [Xanthomonas]